MGVFLCLTSNPTKELTENKPCLKFGSFDCLIYLCILNKHTMKIKTQKGYKRDEQVKQGMYDGRFKLKIVLDKKKQDNKFRCRKSGGSEIPSL